MTRSNFAHPRGTGRGSGSRLLLCASGGSGAAAPERNGGIHLRFGRVCPRWRGSRGWVGGCLWTMTRSNFAHPRAFFLMEGAKSWFLFWFSLWKESNHRYMKCNLYIKGQSASPCSRNPGPPFFGDRPLAWSQEPLKADRKGVPFWSNYWFPCRTTSGIKRDPKIVTK